MWWPIQIHQGLSGSPCTCPSVSPHTDRLQCREHRHHWFLFFQHQDSSKQRLFWIKQKPACVRVWAYLNNIYFSTRKTTLDNKKVLNMRWGELDSLKSFELAVYKLDVFGQFWPLLNGYSQPYPPIERSFCECQMRDNTCGSSQKSQTNKAHYQFEEISC